MAFCTTYWCSEGELISDSLGTSCEGPDAGAGPDAAQADADADASDADSAPDAVDAAPDSDTQ
jgi:hypothetical protein